MRELPAMTLRLDFGRWAAAAGFAGLAVVFGALAGLAPELALGGAFLGAFLVLAFADLTAGLIAFVAVVFLESVLPGGPVLSLTKLTGAVLALSWAGRLTISKQRDSFISAHPYAFFALVAFLGWGVISATWSATASGTLTELTRYLQVMALLVIVYSAVRTRTQFRWVIGAFLLGTVVTATYGMAMPPSADPSAERLASTVGNPNHVATVLVAGIVLALAAALASRRAPLIRVAAIGVVGIAAVGLVLTGSRSGVISLAAVLLIAPLIAGPRWRLRTLGAALAAAVTTMLLFAAFAPEGIRERIAETTPGQVSPDEGRLTIWQVGWRMVEDQPLRGVGVGSFQESSVSYVLQPGALTRTDQVIDEPEVAHNIYLQALAEGGLVGGLLFGGIVAFPVGCAMIAARNFSRAGDRDMEIMSRALALALVAFLAADFFASEQFNKLLWLLFGLGPALLGISRLGVGDGGDEPAEIAERPFEAPPAQPPGPRVDAA